MKNLVRTAFCSTVLLLPATTHAVHALVPELSTTFYASAAEDDGSYTAGTRAMDEHRWSDAVTSFDKVISQKGDRVDAALYWKAYSFNKLGKTPLAVATCEQLRSQFGASPWNKDCGAISVNVDAQVLAEEKVKSKMKDPSMYIRVAPYDRDRERVDDRVTPGSDEDLKILALNSLMHRDPATALPLLRGILTGNQSLSVKKHALFILAQNKSPEAESTLRDAALGKLDPQLQSQAIQALAVYQGKSANDTLAEVYRTTTDPKIKKSIISAMFITKDAPRLVEMAKNEKDLQLKRDIVSQLAVMNDPAATEYMMELLNKSGRIATNRCIEPNLQENPMRPFLRVVLATTVLSFTPLLFSQQPTVLHGQITTETADHGLNSVIETAKKLSGPTWIGYSLPVVSKFGSGWSSRNIDYLEGNNNSNGDDSDATRKTFDHAVILLRVADGAVTKIHVEDPDRQLDAGGVRFIWLSAVDQDDSIRVLTDLARQDSVRHSRDSAVFAISVHQANSATTALINLAAPANDLTLRDKAAFWLANQRGAEGLAAIKKFAHDDSDPKFREKLTFDLTLSKDPTALDEIIRMAHEDSSPQVRKQAQFWMANKGGKRVTEDLKTIATNDPNEQIRKSAVFALSRLPGDEGTTQLIAVADSTKDPMVRKQAIFWLGQSNDPRALDYLTKLLKQ